MTNGLPKRLVIAAIAFPGLAALTSGCAVRDDKPRPASIIVEPESKSVEWRSIASAEDEARIERIGLAWQEALAQARKTAAAELRREGDLLKPLAALPRPAPTPGSYNCRLLKLGRTKTRGPVFERFKPFFCYVQVEGDLLTIIKQTGSERPAGRLWDDDEPKRLVFLGSLALGNEEQPLAYGDDPKRDMAGVFERIAPFRWRLVIPWPRGTSKLDVFELTPVANQPQ